MKKLWYTETSWDKWWAVFTFKDADNTYAIRLAGNPILILEHYYTMRWGTEFMKVYNFAKLWQKKNVSVENRTLLLEAKNFCEQFIDVIKSIENSNKSTFVIYKN